MAETSARVGWNPLVVGPTLYRRLSATYDYGYAADTPKLVRQGDQVRFYPSEYANLRPFSLAVEKGESTVRVFTLGGSVSRGSGLQPGTDYSARLGELLTSTYPDRRWEVVNLSADGFGTSRMLLVLGNMLRFEPDLLVIHPHGSNEFEDEQDARYRAELHTGMNRVLLESRAIVLLKKLEARLLAPETTALSPAEAEEIASSDPVNVAQWMVTMSENLDRFECFAEAARLPIIYVGRAERDAPGFTNEQVQRLNAPIRDHPNFVDVAGLFRGRGSPAELFFDNTHYSELGHEIVAQRLFEMLQPNGTSPWSEIARPDPWGPTVGPDCFDVPS